MNIMKGAFFVNKASTESFERMLQEVLNE